MEFHIGSQAPKIAIFHIFVSSGGNFLYQKAHEIFHFNFPGRVPAIFYWICASLCKSYFNEEIFKIKIFKSS